MGHTEDDAPPGAPEWIVTFADMTSLLVTFFVMLMTFSTMERLESILVSGVRLIGRGGAISPQDNLNAPAALDEEISPKHDPREGSTAPHVRPVEHLGEDLEAMGQKLSAEHLELDLSQVSDGLLLTFGPEACFAPGSVALTPALARSLSELGRVLASYPHLIVVEGFTDSAFQPTPVHPDAQALGLARARSAARALLAASSLSPRQVQIAGPGDARFVAPNDSAVERTLNRRVELRVLSLSRSQARAAHREDRR